MTIPNTDPVVLDAAGRIPDIFFAGLARFRVTNADESVTYTDTDPVGDTTVTSGAGPYDPATTYDVAAVVISDGKYWASLVDNNIGNDPATTPAAWSEVRFNGVYNTLQTYDIGAMVILDNETLWISLQGGNLGNDPGASPAFWRQIGGGALSWDQQIQAGAFNAANGFLYHCDTTGGPFTVTLPTTPAVGDLVGFVDYAGTFLSNPLALDPGAENIMGLAEPMNLDIDFASLTFQYVDATRGWIFV
jgi:hypothetical protein